MENKYNDTSFIKAVKLAISENCDVMNLENEIDGFAIYLTQNNSGITADLTNDEIYEVSKFIRKVKKLKNKFEYEIDKSKYEFIVKFRQDFGEEVWSIKYKKIV